MASFLRKLIPARRFVQLDLNFHFVFIDVVVFAISMPAGGDHLNQDFSARDAGNLQGTVLIGLEVLFGLLVLAGEECFSIGVADIDAGAADGLARFGGGHGDAQFGFRRIVGFLFLFGIRIGRRGLIRDAGAALARRSLILAGRRWLGLRLRLRPG